MKIDRMRRIDELIHRELGMLCEREIAPDIAALVTITKVKTSPDLRHAQVFFSVLGDEIAHQAALTLMHKKRRRLQQDIATSCKLKYTPVLKFHVDQAPEEADRVLSIIHELGLDEVPDAGPDDAGSTPS